GAVRRTLQRSATRRAARPCPDSKTSAPTDADTPPDAPRVHPRMEKHDDGTNSSLRKTGEGFRRSRFPAGTRRTRQAHLREHLEGSLAGLAQAADHADQRKPPEHGRSARAPIPDQADREISVRRRRRYGLRL